MFFQHGGERGFFDIHDSCTVGKQNNPRECGVSYGAVSLGTGFSTKNKKPGKLLLMTVKMRGLIQMARMGKSTRDKWVKMLRY